MGYCLTVILRNARNFDGESYQQMVFQMYGRKAEQCLITMIIFVNFMCGVSYLIVINSQMIDFLGGIDRQSIFTGYPFIMGASCALALPFSQYRSIDSLGSTSMIGVIAVLFFVIVII